MLLFLCHLWRKSLDTLKKKNKKNTSEFLIISTVLLIWQIIYSSVSGTLCLFVPDVETKSNSKEFKTI